MYFVAIKMGRLSCSIRILRVSPTGSKPMLPFTYKLRKHRRVV